MIKISIPREQLLDLGFMETKKKGRFVKQINEKIAFYCDYSSGRRMCYAFNGTENMDHTGLKDFYVIKKIEEEMAKQKEILYETEEDGEQRGNTGPDGRVQGFDEKNIQD